MKDYTKDFEMISAYLDNELSENEKREIEEKISLNKALKEKFNELKSIKNLTSSAYKPLPESNFLETRILAGLKSEKSVYSKIKRWSPAIVFSVLTIGLMLLLKFNPGIIDKLIETQKTNLASFYTENLKPLLFTANLSNEDIFNFAFYNKLPLDSSKSKYLELGSDSSGKGFFEIKQENQTPAVAGNFDKFVKSLDLNNNQRKQFDSIMAAYAEDLQSQVLVNNENTIAINPNLWNYQKAISADLLAFASKTNKQEFEKFIPSGAEFYENPDIGKIVSRIKNTKDNEYIFLTPDTIFSHSYVFNKEKFKAQMEQVKKELNKELAELNTNLNDLKIKIKFDSSYNKLSKQLQAEKDFKIYINPNSIRVHLANIQIPEIPYSNFDSIANEVEKATKNLKHFNFVLPKELKINPNVKFKFYNGDSIKTHEFRMKINQADSSNKQGDSTFFFNGKLFKIPNDSLFARMKHFMNDSLIYLQNEQIQKQLKEFQKEMENFRKEMQNFQKQKTVPKEKSKKSITI